MPETTPVQSEGFTEQMDALTIDSRKKNRKQSEERIANALPIPGRLIDHGEIFSPYILPPNTGISIPIPKDYFQLIVLTIDEDGVKAQNSASTDKHP